MQNVIAPRRTLPVLLAAPLLAVLLLTGCAADDEATPAAGSAPSAEASEESTTASGDDVCGRLEDEGATGASFGPVQAWLPKAEVIGEIDAKLTPMTAVEPPAEVVEAWTAQQDYLETLRAAAEQLPEGGVINDAGLYGLADEVSGAQDTLTDWWFDTCR